MNDNEAAAEHKHPAVSKKQSMLFVRIVPLPLHLFAWRFGWLFSMLVHNHVRRSFLYCSFVRSHVRQLIVVRTSFQSFFCFWFLV